MRGSERKQFKGTEQELFIKAAYIGENHACSLNITTSISNNTNTKEYSQKKEKENLPFAKKKGGEGDLRKGIKERTVSWARENKNLFHVHKRKVRKLRLL